MRGTGTHCPICRAGYAARVNTEIVALVEQAAAKLGELGARIERRHPGFAQPSKIFEAHWRTGAANVRRAVAAEKRALLGAVFNHFADLGERTSGFLRAPQKIFRSDAL
jgi:hypothetical protein